MCNNETIKLNLTRHEICQINLALTSLICEMNNEVNSVDVSEDRKKVLVPSIDMWKVLREKVENQLKAQDK